MKRRRIGVTCLAVASALVVGGLGTQRVATAAADPAVAAGGSTTSGAPGTDNALPPARKPSPLPTAGTLKSRTYPGVTVTLNGVTRGAGGLLTARWTITNHADDSFGLSEFGDLSAPGVLSDFSGMTLASHSDVQRYYPLSSNGWDCYCYNGGGDVEAGDSRTVFTVYRPSPTPSRVDMHVLHFGALKDVNVTSP